LTEPYIPDFIDYYNGLLNATVTNCNVLKEIEDELSKLKPETDYCPGGDTRLKFNIYNKDKSIKTLCMSGIFGTEIYIGGVLQQPNNRLVYLLRNSIGYYPWFDDDYENYYHYMDELQDTTFVREPFIESSYYKKYKAGPIYKKFKEMQENKTREKAREERKKRGLTW
jgi:hypothetical protein